jgi:electron transfer flavoprotein beta subunit
VANALDLPCLAGVKKLEITGRNAVAWREIEGGWEVYEILLPAVITVKEGINLPRNPSLRGSMKAKKKPINRTTPQKPGAALQMQCLKHPPEQGKQVEMLGEGPAAAAKVVEVLKSLEVIQS